MDSNKIVNELAKTMFQQVLIGSEGLVADTIQARLDDAFDRALADAMMLKGNARQNFFESIDAVRVALREVAGP